MPGGPLGGVRLSGPGRGSGQGWGQTGRLGAGGRPLKRPQRLPPPGSSAPGRPRPAPEPRSTPASSARLRAPAAASASPSRATNQHPERRGGKAAIHSAEPVRRGGASCRMGRG